MAKVTVLNCWAAETYPLAVPVISFNEYNGPQSQLHQYPLGKHHPEIIRLFCDDVEEEIDSTYRLFDFIDALKIIEFLGRHPGEDIMVHCAAGVSRSPACALFMIEQLGYDRDYDRNGPSKFFDRHNTHIHYILKRAILERPEIHKTLKEINDGQSEEI